MQMLYFCRTKKTGKEYLLQIKTLLLFLCNEQDNIPLDKHNHLLYSINESAGSKSRLL